MLAEFALWLTTPVPRAIRRMGLLGDSVRLWSRGRRRAADWASHEAQCHAIAHKAMADLPRFDTVVVLGSGLARDVPLEALCAAFKRVVLVDAVHLLPLRLKVRRFSNVMLETRELTGLAGLLDGSASVRVAPLADLQADNRIDLVISANVLSQLPLPVTDWLERQPDLAGLLPPDPCRAVIDWHLADCAGFAARICLLTDTGYVERDREGKVTETVDLLHGRNLPVPDASWDWAIAPKGELRGGYSHVHRAQGHSDFKAG
ncbi:MAG: hypothetical protein ACRC56_10470 [Bosea sp. (in: a-proteobacteria)]